MRCTRSVNIKDGEKLEQFRDERGGDVDDSSSFAQANGLSQVRFPYCLPNAAQSRVLPGLVPPFRIAKNDCAS